MLPCMKSEIQVGLTAAKTMQERQHGKVTENLIKFVEFTERTRILFFRPEYGSGATSRSGVDAKERER